MTAKRTDRPTSRKQADANRRNAQRSTGPTTDAGRLSAASNSLRHGLYATRVVAIPRGVLAEDEAEVEAFIEEVVADLAPRGVRQELAARQVALCYLRVVRFEAFEALQLATAGRLPASLRMRVPGIGTEAEVGVRLAALRRFLDFAHRRGQGALGDVDEDVLLALLPEGASRRSSPEEASVETMVCQLAEEVWMGDWQAAINWAVAIISSLEAALESVDGVGSEYAASAACDRYLEQLTVLYARLDLGLDRAIARYRQLQAAAGGSGSE